MTDIELYIDMLERAGIAYTKFHYELGFGNSREGYVDVDIEVQDGIDISFSFKTDGSLSHAQVENMPCCE